ncbi:molybdenum cofactor synthesis domain protein [Gordonia bronchialis DSM 43247]|uniref:Molybdopterin molybdenumtransferase n=1 Tax=Gordonia bronchialis (strain ATCC 25592 / DSM 43247 / BCRC 13721 / JCM 3198 / KCTC 3076 / NBRC 16047 / NCTC 10667) TaxID=526226 RepID=D0L6D9_GORB4|nr:gephyrin-like molybdotransferase Glp [Gordonia bronchialis]ACY20696.1 molybdenum cofactor synthesis domain protein [Gordonia bronchialis DSM 43247]MCC3323469.1 molybdopterin molybdotransferase MoeA [Gordonia bronchialis]QGS25551.1 molybdopterin molybdenumtransferase [Gordonia bronchialis]STQ63525.1 Molybdopterin molybdenumtransferase [Gordonia bronchialis]
MRSVEDHLTLVTAAAVAPRPVRVAISESQGLMCAEEVITELPMPGFDQAAIDGYAVRAVDVALAGTIAPEDVEDFDTGGAELVDLEPNEPMIVSLPVVGEVGPGARTPTRLQPRQAVRVETGAPMPTLADAVVPLRWTDGGDQKVKIGHGVDSGDYVRRVGDDVQPGDVAVRAGSIIGPAQVGLLAAVGQSRVMVHPRPRLSVISVGSELVDIDRTPGPGQIYDVNSYALAAAARDAGADVNRVGIAERDASRMREVVEAQLIRSEIVVICGAIGGSASRAVADALADLGELEIVRVAMHPGSVQGFGRLGRDEVPTFLLPANPVSALVTFEVMVRPLIRIALGKRQPMRRIIKARTIGPIASVQGRKGYLRGQLMRDERSGDYLVQVLGASPTGSSHLLAELAEANCLIMVDADVEELGTGDEVDVSFLAQRG